MTDVHRRRVEDRLQRLIAELIQRRLDDPRLGLCSVTRVELSPDLKYGNVFLSVVGAPSGPEVALSVVQRASGFLRSEIGRVTRLRRAPELQYRLDQGVDAQARIEALLRENPTVPDEDADPTDNTDKE